MEINAFFYPLILVCASLWSAAMIIDKILADAAHQTPLMGINGVFNLVFAGLLAVVMYFTGQGYLPLNQTIPLMLNGILYVAGMWMYMKVLCGGEEVSAADPWFQTIPMFGAVGGYFMLGEVLEWYHILAIMMLVGGGFWVGKHNGKMRLKYAVLMLAAALCLAMNDAVLAEFGRSEDIKGMKDFSKMIPVIFADVSGKALFALLLIAVNRKHHAEFAHGLKTKFKLQAMSDVCAISADFVFDIAKLVMPIAVIQSGCCVQPLITLLACWFITKKWPHLIDEDISNSTIKRKLGGIALVIVGGVIFAVTT